MYQGNDIHVLRKISDEAIIRDQQLLQDLKDRVNELEEVLMPFAAEGKLVVERNISGNFNVPSDNLVRAWQVLYKQQ